MDKYYKKWFFPFAIPAIILYVAVVVVPFLLGLLYSFTAWKGTYFANVETGHKDSIWNSFVGFKNYIQAFQNQEFTSAFIYTIVYTIVAVIAINIVALLLALMINKLMRGAGLFRTIFFLPNLLGGLALGYIWQIIFQNVYPMLFGPDSPISIPFLNNMLQNRWQALFALAIMVTWQMAGYMMIIYITGLNNIPSDLYEAAEIDGATSFQRFKVITLPMLMPAFTVVFFLTLANSFKLLDQNIALTNGNFDTRLLATQILKTVNDTAPPNYGQAQAQAVIFFIVIAIITLFQVNFTKKREVEM